MSPLLLAYGLHCGSPKITEARDVVRFLLAAHANPFANKGEGQRTFYSLAKERDDSETLSFLEGMHQVFDGLEEARKREAEEAAEAKRKLNDPSEARTAKDAVA